MKLQTPKKSRLGRAGGRNFSQRSEYVQETQDHTVLSQNGVLTAELRKRNWLTESFLVVYQISLATSFSIFSWQKTQVFSWEEKIAKLNCSLVSIVILFAVRVRKNDSLISLFKHFLISQTTRDATDHDGIERPLPEQRLTTNSEKDGSKIRWLPQNPTYENWKEMIRYD